MLISDEVYKRIPQYWLIVGVIFVIFGLAVGSSFRYFPAYMGLGALCIARSVWIYQSRWRYFKRNEFRMTQAIDVKKLKENKTE